MKKTIHEANQQFFIYNLLLIQLHKQ